MQKGNDFDKTPLSTKRVVSLQVLYWIFFIFVLPQLLSRLLYPLGIFEARQLFIIQWVDYLLCMIIAIILAFPLFKKEYKLDIAKMAYTITICIAIMFLMNFLFAIIMNLLNGPSVSNNQNALLQFMPMINRWYYFFMSVFIGPILEEIVFRGAIFRTLRHKKSFLFAAIVSALLFGFVHVQSSLFAGDFQDLIYIILYGSLGFILAYAYEYNKSIMASITIHVLYNFIITAVLLF